MKGTTDHVDKATLDQFQTLMKFTNFEDYNDI